MLLFACRVLVCQREPCMADDGFNNPPGEIKPDIRRMYLPDTDPPFLGWDMVSRVTQVLVWLTLPSRRFRIFFLFLVGRCSGVAGWPSGFWGPAAGIGWKATAAHAPPGGFLAA